MSMILIFIGNWNQWYCVLHYHRGLGPLESALYALWLARG
jgi:hypothetical protein